MPKISALDKLKQELATLDQQFHSTYRTPEAIYALMKTIKTFNITITDWNTLIDYINVVGNTLDALYGAIPDLTEAIDELHGVDLVSDQTVEGVKTFSDGIKVPTPTESDDAVTKAYVDAADATLENNKLNKVPTPTTYMMAYVKDADGTQKILGVTSTVDSNLIVRRDGNGQVFVPENPTHASHATSKAYVDRAVTSVYKYKGSVATVAQLPTTNLTVGDIYDVQEDGQNYAWNGTTWDSLGVNSYTKEQLDARFIAAAFLAMDEYDSETGNISFHFDPAYYSMSYNDATGILTLSTLL